MKVQEAATVFAQVRDVALKVENPKPSDLTADFLMMAEKLMLAQGHECVYWIASKDQKSPLILARVAKQASGIYAEALGFLANPFVREDLDKSWQVRDGLIHKGDREALGLRIWSRARAGCSKHSVSIMLRRMLDRRKISRQRFRD